MDPTEELDALLAAAAEDATRAHWESYLRGRARFRGVPMAGVRRAVRAVWQEHGLDGRDVEENLGLALEWFALPYSEDKLAAVLLVAEHLAGRLEDRHAQVLRRPLRHGDVADWNAADWYATRSLHAFLVGGAGPHRRGPLLAEWCRGPGLWERRAGLVVFVKVAATVGPGPEDAGLAGLVLDACAANLVVDERFAHTGPGWVLRELSTGRPHDVAAFVDAHPELSAEGRRMATARLRTGPYRRR